MKYLNKKNIFGLIAAGMLACAGTAAQAQEKAANLDELLQMMKSSKVKESAEHKKREAEFMREKSKRASLLADAKKLEKQEEDRSDKLEAEYEELDLKHKALRAQLEERKGSLNELFGHLKEASSDLQANLKNSIVSLQFPGRSKFAADLSEKMESHTRH